MKIARGTIAMAALALLIAAGALKVVRYTATGKPQGATAMERINGFISRHGWSGTGETWEGTGGLYTAARFVRAGCDAPLTVAILSASEEAADLARRDLGDSMAFVQSGAVVTRPSAITRQAAGLIHWIRHPAGHVLSPPLPIVAVSPAPMDSDTACGAPAPVHWKVADRNPVPNVHDR